MKNEYHWQALWSGLRIPLAISTILGFCVSCSTAEMHKKRRQLYADFDKQFLELLASTQSEMGKEVLRYEQIGKDLLPRKITIGGTHRDLGRLIGLIAKNFFGDVMKREIFRKPESEEIHRRIIDMYRSVNPKYLDLVSGVAEAWDLSLNDINMQYMEHWFFTLLWWRLFRYDEFEELTAFSPGRAGWFDFSGCTVICHYDDQRQKHLAGRNFDVTSDRPHFFVTSDLEGTYKTMGNACYMIHHWVEDGINEKGLFVGVATSGEPSKYNQREKRYPDKPAVQVIHMTRIVLETCASVEEALERIGSVRIWFPVEVNHLLLADAKGEAAVVEFDLDRNMVVFRRSRPYLVLTNTAYQEGFEFLKSNCRRFRKATELLDAGIRSDEEMLSVIRAARLRSGRSRTLWTSVTDLSKKRMDVRYLGDNYDVPHVFELNR